MQFGIRVLFSELLAHRLSRQKYGLCDSTSWCSSKVDRAQDNTFSEQSPGTQACSRVLCVHLVGWNLGLACAGTQQQLEGNAAQEAACHTKSPQQLQSEFHDEDDVAAAWGFDMLEPSVAAISGQCVASHSFRDSFSCSRHRRARGCACAIECVALAKPICRSSTDATTCACCRCVGHCLAGSEFP